MLDDTSHPLIMKSLLLVISMLYLLSLMYIISSTTFLYSATTRSFFITSFEPSLPRLKIEVSTVRDCWLRISGFKLEAEPSRLKKSIWLDYSVNMAILLPRLTIFSIGVACFMANPEVGAYFIKAVLPGS